MTGWLADVCVGTAASVLMRPDHVVFDSGTSDDLLTPGADEDLCSPLPGQERQALLNDYMLDRPLHVPACLRYDIPGYTSADRNSQSAAVSTLKHFPPGGVDKSSTSVNWLGVKAGMSTLSGGGYYCVIPYGTPVPPAVRLLRR